jgi:hypothetical protein
VTLCSLEGIEVLIDLLPPSLHGKGVSLVWHSISSAQFTWLHGHATDHMTSQNERKDSCLNPVIDIFPLTLTAQSHNMSHLIIFLSDPGNMIFQCHLTCIKMECVRYTGNSKFHSRTDIYCFLKVMTLQKPRSTLKIVAPIFSKIRSPAMLCSVREISSSGRFYRCFGSVCCPCLQDSKVVYTVSIYLFELI